MTENDKYREKHYPNLHPCVDGCHYWRSLLTGAHQGKKSKACHYCLENNELRGCEPDLIHGTCEQYDPGDTPTKRILPYYKIPEKR